MISLIVATGENRVIGLNNKMPWHLPADLAYFKNTTSGHAVVMGRKTFESIGRPLPNRTNIILTRDENFQAEGCQVIHSVEEALQLGKVQDLFIIGGAEIYHQFLAQADRVYLTYIEENFEGDTFFPELTDEWKLVSTEKHLPDEKNQYNYEFRVYEKNQQLIITNY
ncbi:type 3 dihydrofolate reductase [Anaerobacillus isosaccharinicus]|uniref:Dihydrofolate reductase n=1 Tax=Anaerobacillus isosaccharinicus TaxID=1532552 RepID=A0A1S2MDU6_9BACI|nr:type 3 dihydrofolate reductase [Anaerobacillus isosaccharinicus]MBA5588571.1 type 3 dihydrofolate reductase [Anaerobacillus isosaccharinicus]QOY38014.1 type 3 dihydrofolate reductase [Anaerobacillus isosaccharinicus]